MSVPLKHLLGLRRAFVTSDSRVPSLLLPLATSFFLSFSLSRTDLYDWPLLRMRKQPNAVASLTSLDYDLLTVQSFCKNTRLHQSPHSVMEVTRQKQSLVKLLEVLHFHYTPSRDKLKVGLRMRP